MISPYYFAFEDLKEDWENLSTKFPDQNIPPKPVVSPVFISFEYDIKEFIRPYLPISVYCHGFFRSYVPVERIFRFRS
jgi:hypothetical protein